MLGGFLIGVIGIFLPPVMFWGEFEIGTLADPNKPLPHIWPKGGFYGEEPFMLNDYHPPILLVVALVKLVAVSITVVSGFRGGFIFPLFFAGTSLGLAITHIPSLPWINGLPDAMVAMTMAAGQLLPGPCLSLGVSAPLCVCLSAKLVLAVCQVCSRSPT